MKKKLKANMMVETVFAVPLLLMTVLAVVDMTRWMTEKTALWVLARQWVRLMAQSPPETVAIWEPRIRDDLNRRRLPADIKIGMSPLAAQPLLHPFRLRKKIDVIELRLKRTLPMMCPLLHWAFDRRKISLEVYVYEVRSQEQ